MGSIIRDDHASSPITVSGASSDPLDSFLSDPSAAAASGSFHNDSSVLSSDSANLDADFGFSRADFGAEPLSGSVDLYRRHVFLCYKNPRVWPPRVEAAEFDRLPRLLSAAVSARKPEMKRETRLTICEGHDGTETSNGDVLIFPDMVRYRRLTHFDVETFVEEVLVKDSDWLPMTPETLKGSYIFVCCHGSRDRRCGVCGPALVSRFRDEIELHGLIGKVSVSPCSHIGGHKYAGNVIVFGPNRHGEVTGHWYGYVTPDDVTELLELHVGQGEIVNRLWRGQMGLSEEEQVESQNRRLQMNGEKHIGNNDTSEISQLRRCLPKSSASCSRSELKFAGCCQENGNDSPCCQNPSSPPNPSPDTAKKPKLEKKNTGRKLLSRMNSVKGNSTRRVCSMPTWLESWEREDTYAALAVACAAVSVAVAYSYYKQLR